MTDRKPIINNIQDYVKGGAITVASTTTLSVAATNCLDDSGVYDITLSSATTINAANNGINGLDTGSLANATWYYIYVIADSALYNTTGTLVSASATAPTMPAGYDTKRIVGLAKTGGSADFLTFYQTGDNFQRTYWWDILPNVISGGNATTYTAINCIGGAPPIENTEIKLNSSLTPNTAANVANFRPTGATATTALGMSAPVAAEAHLAQFDILSKLDSGNPSIDYKVAEGTDALSMWIVSFNHNI